MKNCLECNTEHDDDALTCSACGGGSWPEHVEHVDSKSATDPCCDAEHPHVLQPGESLPEVGPDGRAHFIDQVMSGSMADIPSGPLAHDGEESTAAAIQDAIPTADQLPVAEDSTPADVAPKTGARRGKKDKAV